MSVLTPVYNGEQYISRCIESVLAQSYRNFEYIIVNNCSSDSTLDIVKSYAAKDCRIRVHTNREFVGAIENHNIAFGLIARESQYTKVVSADDWLYPRCLTELVEFAERNPTVSMVGAYTISDDGVDTLGLPHDKCVFQGREICRLYLLGKVASFALPSALMYRSDVVRSLAPFYPGSAPSADLAACMNCLKDGDFGFVHQILAFQHLHEATITSRIARLNGFYADRLEFLIDYGRRFLTAAEYNVRKEHLLREYYKVLAIGVIHCREAEFWKFHSARLSKLGYSLYSWRLVWAVLSKLAGLALNPKASVEKLFERLRKLWPV